MKIKEKKLNLKVIRTVQTPTGDTYCLVANGTKEHWISLTEMVDNQKTVLKDLATAGITIISSAALTELKNILQNHPKPSLAHVASQPGWVLENAYVHPNGEVQKGEKVDAEIIVAFIPDFAYGQSGTLKEWKKAFAPFTENQMLMTFGMCYAFSAVLLAKTNPSHQNPIVELYGDREAGKSTFGLSFGSVYGGNPDGDIGIGRTANGTAASFKPTQRMTNDTLLFLDETNIMDRTVEENLRLFFDHTSRDERLRFNSTSRTQAIRNTLIITGNERLVSRTKASSAIIAAAQSRCLSVNVGNSVLNDDDMTKSERDEFLVKLRNHSNQFYGTASRAYVSKIISICEKDSDKFAARLFRIMDRFHSKVGAAPHMPNRLKTTIALSYAAGYLAKSWNIWPSDSSIILKSCKQIYAQASQLALTDSIHDSASMRRLLHIIKSHPNRIFEIDASSKKNKSKPISRALGYKFYDDLNMVRLFFEKNELISLLGASATSDLKEIRKLGYLKGEGGKSSRLMSKAPKFVPIKGRGYEFSFPSDLIE